MYREGYVPGPLCVAPTSASPDFIITPTGPSAWTTNEGLTISGQFLIQETDGFHGSVALSCSGLAEGDICSFSPAVADLTTAEASTVLLTITTAATHFAGRSSGQILPGNRPDGGERVPLFRVAAPPCHCVRRHEAEPANPSKSAVPGSGNRILYVGERLWWRLFSNA